MKILKSGTAAVLLMSAPLAAMAHVHLQSSIPAAGSTVKASPERLVLVFQEAVELKALSVQKVGDSAATALVIAGNNNTFGFVDDNVIKPFLLQRRAVHRELVAPHVNHSVEVGDDLAVYTH